MKQMPATEAQIQRTITDWLTIADIPFTVTDAAHVTIQGVTRGRSKIRTGWPDITACLPPDGTLLAIEVKSAKGKLRLDQEAVLGQLEEAGAVVVVARSLDDVVMAIKVSMERFHLIDGAYMHYVPFKLVRAIAGLLEA